MAHIFLYLGVSEDSLLLFEFSGERSPAWSLPECRFAA